MDDERSLTIPFDALRRFATSVFSAAGLSDDDAATMADTLATADLRGTSSHGVIRLPFLVDRLEKGGANPNPALAVVNDAPSTALIDGDGALGPVTASRAMRMAMDKARTQGVGFVAARNSDFIGACAYYAMMAVPEDMIGMAWTNGSPGMVAWGGRSTRIGNNPVAFACPGGSRGPVVLDMALSVAAGGRVRLAAKRNQRIPLDWVVDRNGQATDDPAALPAGGALLPLGYKGYGLAVFGEILAGVLTGSNILDQVPQWFVDTHRRVGNGHVHLAIDIARFIDPTAFKRRIDALTATLKSSPLAEGVEQILVPGERAWSRERTQRRTGVVLSRQAASDLHSLAQRMGLESPPEFH